LIKRLHGGGNDGNETVGHGTVCGWHHNNDEPAAAVCHRNLGLDPTFRTARYLDSAPRNGGTEDGATPTAATDTAMTTANREQKRARLGCIQHSGMGYQRVTLLAEDGGGHLLQPRETMEAAKSHGGRRLSSVWKTQEQRTNAGQDELPLSATNSPYLPPMSASDGAVHF